MSHRFAIRKLAEAQFGVNLTGNRPKFRTGLKEVVNFSDRRQDVERLSVDALPVWGAGPREAACLLCLSATDRDMLSAPSTQRIGAGKTLRPRA
jgi:hypothetical protein